MWEFWQVPFYQGIASDPHWRATKVCSLAAVGDAAIMVLAFWVVAVVAHTRAWVMRPFATHVVIFTMAGMAVTVVAEWLATEQLQWWTYADRMPTVPLLGTGLLPLLQWVILPPLVIWFIRRQLV